MTITRRTVPVITVADMDAECHRYVAILGLSEVMNLGWIVTLADESGAHQISLMTQDQTARVNPQASIEVDDVDLAYATACEHGLEIVHELQKEPWGVRRFFVRDASGNVINVLTHTADHDRGAIEREENQAREIRRAAVMASSGKYGDAFGPDYLADLRRDWPA